LLFDIWPFDILTFDISDLDKNHRTEFSVRPLPHDHVGCGLGPQKPIKSFGRRRGSTSPDHGHLAKLDGRQSKFSMPNFRGQTKRAGTIPTDRKNKNYNAVVVAG
jgi:hypothetical protein